MPAASSFAVRAGISSAHTVMGAAANRMPAPIIAVDDAVTGLRGNFIIDAVTHDVTDGLHLMTLGLSQRGGAA